MTKSPSSKPPKGSPSPSDPSTQDGIAQRFHPAILDFEREDDHSPAGGRRFLYRLRDDLDRLARNLDQMDSDVVVLFCARIVEATCQRAVAFARPGIGGGPDTHNLATNIEFLKARRLMPGLVATWAHNLRLMGNAARHLLRPMSTVDMQLATAFLEAYLGWFFCQYEFQLSQYRTVSLHSESTQPPIFARSEEITRLIGWLAASPPALDDLVAASRDEEDVFHLALAFATLTAEKLLDAGRGDAARQVLEAAVEHHEAAVDDVRWRQMMGLCHSRAGQFDEAETWLARDSDEFNADPETVGILGGMLKRRYLAAVDTGPRVIASRWLLRAAKTYEGGWEKSKKTNFYHGINTAALYLWRGEIDTARETAQLIDQRLGAIRKKAMVGPACLRDSFDLWDELTLLEAWLILGRYEEAHAGLASLVAQHGAASRAAFEVFLVQARRHLRTLRELGETDLLETYLDSAVGGSFGR